MQPHPHAALLTRFYTAFAALDGDAMQACYAADARFDDPVFTLRGREQVGGMWRMLTTVTKAKARADWKLDFSGVQADDAAGRAHWQAHYRFSATGRLVHNVIDARFTFTDLAAFLARPAVEPRR